jgi:hypothetical protein
MAEAGARPLPTGGRIILNSGRSTRRPVATYRLGSPPQKAMLQLLLSILQLLLTVARAAVAD